MGTSCARHAGTGMKPTSPVMVVVAGQALASVLCALLWLIFAGVHEALAALTGGAVAIAPGLYFAIRVFAVSADASPERIVGAIYRGEAIKFGLTIVMFIVALKWFDTVFAPLITTYVLAILMYWPALQIDAAKQR